MDLLTKDDLDLLAHDDKDGTHVSLFLPTHRVASEDRTDPLRWKKLLQRCETTLAETGLGKSEISDLLAPAWGLHEDSWEWQHMGDGLVMFLGRGEPRSYRLPFSVPELAVVGERYVTGPLLRAITHDSDFLVLALSQRDVRLLQGTAKRVEQVELRDVPSDLREVMERPDSRTDSHARTLKASRGGGAGAVFYGIGAADDDFKHEELEEFLRVVATGLQKALASQRRPMVLVGLEDNISTFRSVSSYGHILDAEVRTNPDGLSPEKLHSLAWPAIECILDEQRTDALDRIGEALAHDRGAATPVAVAEAAAQGRVETLFVAADPFCWEQLPAGEVVRLGGDGAFGHVELVDRAIADTLSAGGHVYAVDYPTVKGDSDLAAILRY
jgi:hypothetical protein